MNKLYSITLIFLIMALQARAQFVTVWKTDIAGTAFNNRIIIPASGSNYNITWEEIGNADNRGTAVGTGTYPLVFPTPGTYQVSIEPGAGTFNQIKFANSGDKLKLLEIKQWGDIPWANMDRAYEGCTNLRITATDIPDLENVTSMAQMFEWCSSLTTVPEMNNWSVSRITDMSRMFYSATNFNEPIGDWSVRRVTSMNSMFYQARAFNQDLYDWDVSRVTNMSAMFTLATSFNKPVSTWDVSQVTDMSYMFYLAGQFNQPLDDWDVGQVRNFSYMLHSTAFNRPLANWNLENAINMGFIFENTPMDCASMALTLIGWAQNPVTPGNVTLGARGRNYGRQAAAALAELQQEKNWTITIGFETTCTFPVVPFVTLWDTRLPGISGTNQITIPANNVNYTIAWEQEGNPSNAGTVSTSGQHTLTFPSEGLYFVSITPERGSQFAITFNDSGDKDKIQDIRQWGDSRWASMENAFYGCGQMVLTADDAPNLQSVTSLSRMFANSAIAGINNSHLWDLSNVTRTDYMFLNAVRFDDPLESWNVGKVTIMQGMFANARNFNHPIGNWDVSSVTDMSYMFNGAENFNQDLSNWNVGNVADMSAMFYRATAFNSALNNWNVSNATNMASMFREAISFNQPLSNWNVGKVTNMSAMFNGASVFNTTLANWNVSSVSNMGLIFSAATNFNQPLGTWNISSVTIMGAVFTATSMDCVNMSLTLSGWAKNPSAPEGIVLLAGDRSYGSTAVSAIETLEQEKGWTILIGEQVICEALDVKLVSFKATSSGSLVSLIWETASETDNDYFEVERSLDARFWITIARKQGAGTVTTSRHYSEVDKNPLPGVSYYRLKIVDMAGKADYSRIASVRLASPESHFVYPNPASESTTLSGKTGGTFSILNLNGKEVFRQKVTQEKQHISIDHLPTGTYILQMSDGWRGQLFKK